MSDNGQLTDGVVRVLDAGGQIAGAGFVVADDGLIATCAHVLQDGPEASVTVVFQATGEERHARVQPAYWRDSDHGDVAFLQVEGMLPAGVHPLVLGPSAGMRGHRFRTFGYPANGPAEGMYGYGLIGNQNGESGSELLQVTGASEITRGFSGGPVFDEAAGRVIGMTSSITVPDAGGRGNRTAFVIPTETLRAVCGRLEVSARCPYRSLDAFTQADEEFFCGRERAVTAVLDGLERDRRFMAVLGPSGCGKSSLVQAGVLPRLRGSALAGSDRWTVIVARPGSDPLGQLGSSGLPLAHDLTAAVRQWQAAHRGQRLVLVLDQFEELLVAAAEDVRRAFVAQLPEALEQAQPLTVLVVMRDDFYALLAESAPELMGWVAQNQLNVPATLEAGELAAIVEQPASAVGLRFEAGLVDLIVADAVSASGPHAAKGRSTVLPLLEFALTQLWERRADGLLTHQAYHQIGRVTGGLAQWCDRAVDELDVELRPVASTVVTALVHLGAEVDGVPHSRRRRRIAELRAAGEAGAVDKVVAHLTARRLLVTSRQDGQEIVELIHDALIREWPQLGRWLEEDQAFLVWRQRIEDQAATWVSSPPDESRLLRGQQLAEAEEWAARHPARLSTPVTAFVAESQQLQQREQERDRRRIRRLRIVSAFLAVALALALTATGVAVRQSRTAQEARNLATAQQLASRAAANIDQQPLSLLLSIESLRLAPTDEARAALLRGVLEPRHNVIALMGHTSGVYGVAFSPDGRMLASGSADRTVRLWDARTGGPIGRPLAGHTDTVRMVAFSPDGRMLASASEDKTVRLWDARTGALIGRPLAGHAEAVESVAFSPVGRMLATASIDQTVRRWDAATGEQIGQPLLGHTDQVEGIAFSPDGTMIASASEDGTVRRWDAATGAPIGQPLTGHTDQVESVAFSPDGTMIASGSEDGTVRRWDAVTGAPIGEPLRGHGDQVEAVAFSPDGTTIASAGLDNTVRLWDAAAGEPIGEPLTGHTDQIDGLAFSPDGSMIASGSADRAVRLWAADPGVRIGPRMEGHIESVDGLAFSPDGTMMASASGDQMVRLWDARTGDQIDSLIGHTVGVVTVAFSPDGRTIASGGRDNTVRLWDAAAGELIGEPLTGHTNWVVGLAFSPDSARVASASFDGTVRLWDARTGAPIGQPLTGNTDLVLDVAFSPDGGMIVSGGADWMVRRWDAATGELLGQPLDGHTDEVTRVAFSPGGGMIVSGGADWMVRLWDAATGEPIGRPLDGLTDTVREVAFSSDGKTVLAAGEDGTVRLWDARTGAPIAQPLTSYTDNVDGVAFSPDGAMIAAAGTDQIVRLWPLRVDAWIRHACTLAGRNLTQAEWDEFLGRDRPYVRTCPEFPPGLGA